MELYTMTRPSTPLTLACAPSAPLPTPAAAAAVAPWAAAAAPAVTAAERAQVSRAHQVQAQAELAQALLRIDGTTGINGFMGIEVSKKRYADGGSGVPPRGRPV